MNAELQIVYSQFTIAVDFHISVMLLCKYCFLVQWDFITAMERRQNQRFDHTEK